MALSVGRFARARCLIPGVRGFSVGKEDAATVAKLADEMKFAKPPPEEKVDELRKVKVSDETAAPIDPVKRAWANFVCGRVDVYFRVGDTIRVNGKDKDFIVLHKNLCNAEVKIVSTGKSTKVDYSSCVGGRCEIVEYGPNWAPWTVKLGKLLKRCLKI